MKVAIFTNGIWPYVIGGMQKHSYFLCKHLANNKIEVLLVHTAKNVTDDVKALTCFTGDELKYIRSIVIQTPDVPRFPGHYIYQSYLYSKKIYETLGGFPDVDFIIAKGMTGWYFLNKKTNDSPPVGINIHGYEFLQHKADFKSKMEGMMLKWPLTLVNRKADYVFSYGGKITDYVRQLSVPDNRILEIPSAIEKDWMTADIRPSQVKRRFVFVGRLERRKGVNELHKAITRLYGKHTFEFHFIGPIPQSMQLSFPGIIYHGAIHDKVKIKEILNQAHVLVCPSYAEGMPNVILEGMANGCAIIATDVGAVSLLVNENTGWLVPVANHKALEEALENAATISTNELDQKRKMAFDHVNKNFLWEDVIKKMIDAISAKTSRHV
jgi:Glycosyltransferase